MTFGGGEAKRLLRGGELQCPGVGDGAGDAGDTMQEDDSGGFDDGDVEGEPMWR